MVNRNNGKTVKPVEAQKMLKVVNLAGPIIDKNGKNGRANKCAKMVKLAKMVKSAKWKNR